MKTSATSSSPEPSSHHSLSYSISGISSRDSNRNLSWAREKNPPKHKKMPIRIYFSLYIILTNLDSLFEGSNFDLSYKNALLVKGMLFAAFYAPALPTVLVIMLIGIALTYATDKYVLLRRAVLPYSIEDDLTRVMTELLEWMPFAFAV